MDNQVAQGPHPDKIVIMNSVSGWFAVYITWAVAKLTPERRSEIAKKGAEARWKSKR
jgi:hypothetical protein